MYFMFLWKQLVLLNLIIKYVTFASDWFLKSKDIVNLCEMNF